MSLNENVVKFFELYESDESVRAKVQAAEDAYPGSLEIRDALAEATILPVAAELGLPFTLKDLRAYETRNKMSRLKDEEIDPDEPDDDSFFWLLDRGWEYDEELLKKHDKRN